MSKHKVLIVGAGTAGLSIMRGLHRKLKSSAEFTIVDPSEDHYYQPLWTLVGSGVCKLSQSRRDLKNYIPASVNWVKDHVESFQPEKNQVTLQSKKTLSYDYMVVAPGLQINWTEIEGLTETLGSNGVCSNYSKDSVESTWKNIQSLKEGKALFTQPSTPIKCAGAPQKIMYMAEDWFSRQDVRSNINMEFWTAGAAMFGVPKYRAALEKLVEKRNIKPHFKQDLVAISGKGKTATFKNMETGAETDVPFDMIHVTPPMSAPSFVKNSDLSNEAGWVDVDKHTLQHTKYKNVFSSGDASSLPTSKTGAAVRQQGPVLIHNLLQVIKGQNPSAQYNGYASCPIVTKRGGCILAEFGYDGKILETFPFDQAKERSTMYFLKKNVIPFMYWNAMMKGFF